MKKLLSFILAFLLCFSVFNVFAEYSPQEKGITVTYNGENVDFGGAKPQNIGGFTMVPMRAVFELAGCEVSFDTKTKTVIASKENISVKLTIDDKTAMVTENGKSENKKLDIAPCIHSDRTLVPVRFISESLGFTVNWNPNYKEVVIIDFSAFEEKLKESFIYDILNLDFKKKKVHTRLAKISVDFMQKKDAYDVKIIADSLYCIYVKSEILDELLADYAKKADKNIKGKYIKMSVPEVLYYNTGVIMENNGSSIWDSFVQSIQKDEYIYSSTIKNVNELVSSLATVKIKEGEEMRTSASTVIPKATEVVSLDEIIPVAQ